LFKRCSGPSHWLRRHGSVIVETLTGNGIELSFTSLFTPGTYGVMTITDEVGDCKGAKGVYKFTVNGDSATAEMISDECESRGQSSAKMTLIRKS
jgi:uncharacterized protein (DUF2141 family)